MILEILSAEENDEYGNVVAQGKYFLDIKKLTSRCRGLIYAQSTLDQSGDTFLMFNDMHQSPYIVCSADYFVST